MVEDGSLEALELIVRLEPELLGQQPPARAVDLERVRLAAAAVEREHQLAPQTLAQRMLGDEVSSSGTSAAWRPSWRSPRTAASKVASRSSSRRRRSPRGEGHVGQVGERRAAPQGERLAEQPGGGGRLLRARSRDQRLEAIEVELAVG